MDDTRGQSLQGMDKSKRSWSKSSVIEYKIDR